MSWNDYQETARLTYTLQILYNSYCDNSYCFFVSFCCHIEIYILRCPSWSVPFTMHLKLFTIRSMQRRKIIHLLLCAQLKVLTENYFIQQKSFFVHWPIDFPSSMWFLMFKILHEETDKAKQKRAELPAKNATHKSMSIILHTENLIYDKECLRKI